MSSWVGRLDLQIAFCKFQRLLLFPQKDDKKTKKNTRLPVHMLFIQHFDLFKLG